MKHEIFTEEMKETQLVPSFSLCPQPCQEWVSRQNQINLFGRPYNCYSPLFQPRSLCFLLWLLRREGVCERTSAAAVSQWAHALQHFSRWRRASFSISLHTHCICYAPALFAWHLIHLPDPNNEDYCFSSHLSVYVLSRHETFQRKEHGFDINQLTFYHRLFLSCPLFLIPGNEELDT